MMNTLEMSPSTSMLVEDETVSGCGKRGETGVPRAGAGTYLDVRLSIGI